MGSKKIPGTYKTIARGFPTSPRLAVWCNLDIFLRIDRLIKKEFKGKDARISIYVDDIGITASNVSIDEMIAIYPKIKQILEKSDKYQPLPLNDKKTKIITHSGETFNIEGQYLGKFGYEHLGIQMNRNSLTLGTKTRWKLASLNNKLKLSKGKHKDTLKKRKSTIRYKNYIER